MEELTNYNPEKPGYSVDEEERKRRKSRIIQIVLFIVTFITTTVVGAEWIHAKSIIWSGGFTSDMLLDGLNYSIPFLFILTVHEFGHYVMARQYKIPVTLPYYIPLWLPSLLPTIGTAGAFIRIKGMIKTTREYFDVGIAGPLAGFVVALMVIWYGFTHLPPIDYVMEIHPEYKAVLEQKGFNYIEVGESRKFFLETAYYQDSVNFKTQYPDETYERREFEAGQIQVVSLGSNLIFEFFKKYVVKDKSRIPNNFEIIHYPYLFAGFLALFFTALNLLPIGQLDGGHILYGLIGGKRHRIASMLLFIAFISYAGIALSNPYMPQEELIWMIPLHLFILYVLTSGLKFDLKTRLMVVALLFAFQHLIVLVFPSIEGYPGWLFFGFILSRFLGLYHPPALIEQPLDQKRQLLGYLSLLIFVFSFSPTPFVLVTF